MIFTGQEYYAQRLTGDLHLREPVIFRSCHFKGCSLAVRADDTEPIEVSEITIRQCRVTGGGVRGARLRDVIVDGLQVSSMPQMLGNIYEHVTIKGRISQLTIDSRLPTVHEPEPFYRAAENCYASLDWALDITEMVARDVEIRGLPSRLIRLNPEVHAVVTRDAALDGAWRRVDLGGSALRHALLRLTESDWQDVVLIPAAWGKYAEPDRLAIQRLKAAGIAR